MTVKLSIITINLNNAKGLIKTMESVFSQTSHDFEYIVVDGKSSDESKEIIVNYAGKNAPFPFTWISEPDNGIYQAMNKGIRMAQGEYCQFLNSGDWLAAPDVIEKMLSSIPVCSIFYGNMLKQMPKGKILRDRCGQGNITMLSLYRGSLNHSPAFIKRSLFEKYGLYDESLKIVSDWKWYLITIVLNNKSIKILDLDVTFFDMNGISTINSNLREQERRKVLKEILPQRILIDYDVY
jgi:glycosyltransferase involved in cell wall biosynthesis